MIFCVCVGVCLRKRERGQSESDDERVDKRERELIRLLER